VGCGSVVDSCRGGWCLSVEAREREEPSGIKLLRGQALLDPGWNGRCHHTFGLGLPDWTAPSAILKWGLTPASQNRPPHMETPLETVGWSLRAQSSAGGSAVRDLESRQHPQVHDNKKRLCSRRTNWRVPRHGAPPSATCIVGLISSKRLRLNSENHACLSCTTISSLA
jgi:hypothetical protein